MKKAIASVLATTLVAVGLANESLEDVSRLNKDVRLVFEVSLSGASSPSVLFNKTLNSTDEPRFKDHLSPLGQRQQYLIGQEYRLRYVDEARFLNYSYDISDVWIQTIWSGKHIVSAQA